MHPIEQKVRGYLDKVIAGESTPKKENMEWFAQRCVKVLEKHLYPREEEGFRLRMSNIGKSVRQLILEKKYGREKPTGEFLLKMMYGDLYEAVFMLLMKEAGVDFEHDTEVSLNIAGETIQGTLDVDVKDKDSAGIYDVKTASDYSYNFKFNNFTSLQSDDTFGYIAQGIGYGKAAEKPFKGWIVISKVTGDFKIVEVPTSSYDYIERDTLKDIGKTIHAVNNNILPPCAGIEPEKFNGKLTGNKILGSACRFCPHKDKCQPQAKYQPCKFSKAKNTPMKWYMT